MKTEKPLKLKEELFMLHNDGKISFDQYQGLCLKLKFEKERFANAAIEEFRRNTERRY